MLEKLELLKANLSKYNKLAVAYSGGVDSDFLLNVAKEVLGENVIAIIGDGIMLSRKDLDDAINLAMEAGVKYYIVKTDAFSVSEFRNNDKKRCYFCKKNIMSGIISKAHELGFPFIADGKNADDGKVFRPGAMAAHELGIVSPLFDAGFTKNDIRISAKTMNLETWDKPSNSCLATRFPYNTELTEENFLMVETAEKLLYDSGIKSGRIRIHGDIARIEMPDLYFGDFIKNKDLHSKIKKIGFKYITLDLEGFRSGSMD